MRVRTNCERATLIDPETVALCDKIIQSQCEEITRMRGILDRLGI